MLYEFLTNRNSDTYQVYKVLNEVSKSVSGKSLSCEHKQNFVLKLHTRRHTVRPILCQVLQCGF